MIPFFVSANDLHSFLEKEDTTFSWHHEKSVMNDDYGVHYIQMSSQTWRSEKEVNKAVWDHWMKIIVPKNVKNKKALLLIKSGNFTDAMPTEVDENLVNSALSSHSVIAEMYCVPNQPLKFSPTNDRHFEKKAQKEDSLIAHSWKKYLETEDASWILQLPMTKAVQRGMDCVEQFLGSLPKNPLILEGFVLSGRSKRGWTAYLAAAVDDRVIGLIPASCDMLNLEKNFRSHIKTFGDWSPDLKAYVHTGLISEHALENATFKELINLVDPFSYKDKLCMPKYLINATGDAFSPPDSSHHYFHALPGKKYLRYVPNTNHAIDPAEYYPGLIAFYEAVIKNKPLPVISWIQQKDQSLLITTTTAPFEVTLWQTTNKNARDFRIDYTGQIWEPTQLKKQTEGIFVANVDAPEQGWTAYFVELKFPNGKNHPYIFTTEVFITPDVN